MNTQPPSVSRFLPTLIAIALLLGSAGSHADDWPQWRGPQRNGVSHETGLLKDWPKEGPRLLWQIQDAGSGYSTPAVVGERLFLLANDGLDDEFVRALSVKDGRRLWSTRIGKVGSPDQQPKFPAARSTPTLEGDRLYALGSDGDLVCLDAVDGKVRWQKQLRTDFAGKPGTWAYAESPLVDGETLFCTPGGSEATVLALNKGTGEVRWKTAVPGAGDAAYTSAILVETAGSRQIVQMLQKGLVGLSAKTGEVLWRYDKTVSRFNANIPTTVARDGILYTAGAGTGGALLRLKAEGGAIGVEEIAFSPKLPTAIGGAVVVGDCLYGTTGQAMVCIDFASGTVKWEERALGPAALCFADGRLYLHGESGEAGLVEPAPDGYREKGRFTPPDPPKRSADMEKAWAYPVVAGGRLYLRDHNRLWCYDVKAQR
jgi:outer membrane protein assembly factor BamB